MREDDALEIEDHDRIAAVLESLRVQHDLLSASDADPTLLRATRRALAYWHGRLDAVRGGPRQPRGGVEPSLRR